MEFLKADETTRKGLIDEIINVLKNLELDINDVYKIMIMGLIWKENNDGPGKDFYI